MKENKELAKILLIEDDELAIQALKFTIERVGYELAIARDGEEATEMLDSPTDLILLDLVMPRKDGFEVLKIIRQEKHLTTPVIVISNLGRDQDIKRAMELGANDYLVKNEFPIENIVRKIETALRPPTA